MREREKMKNKKKLIKNLLIDLIAAFAALLMILTYFLLYDNKITKKEADEYKAIRHETIGILQTETSKTAERVDEQVEMTNNSQHEANEPETEITYDWDTLQTMNKDIAGWLYIPDSEIDYPVVQSSDNSYYLSHSFNKSDNRSGCLFFDYRSNQVHDNQLIYGHNMGIGKTAMFSTLIKWEDDRWHDDHDTIYYTPVNQETLKLTIFAILKISIKDAVWNTYVIHDFNDETEFDQWISLLMDASIINSDITPQYDNKILTLITCDRRVYGSDGRFVIFAAMK